jgi:dihydroflavonol-4-reductase
MCEHGRYESVHNQVAHNTIGSPFTSLASERTEVVSSGGLPAIEDPGGFHDILANSDRVRSPHYARAVRVLITGGTGFIGSHTVRAVTAAGHDVHLLVRSPARIAPALGPLEVKPPQHTVGDATDPDALRAALDGCDATIHCAAIYSFHPRDAARVAATNRRAAEVVLGESLERGCDPVVYCSSMVSLLPVRAPIASPETPVGDSRVPYLLSKADAERVVRDLQAGRGSLVSVLPGAVTGPHDPYVGESNEYWIRRPLRGMLPFSIARGASALVDVREVAAVLDSITHAWQRSPYLRHGSAPHVERRVRHAAAPDRPETPSAPNPHPGGARQRAWLQRARVGLPVPFTYESVSVLLAGWAPTDESSVRDDLRVAEVPLETSFADTIRWMVETSHLRPAQAGALAE